MVPAPKAVQRALPPITIASSRSRSRSHRHRDHRRCKLPLPSGITSMGLCRYSSPPLHRCDNAYAGGKTSADSSFAHTALRQQVVQRAGRHKALSLCSATPAVAWRGNLTR